MPNRLLRAALVVLVPLALVAACSDDDDTSTAGATNSSSRSATSSRSSASSESSESENTSETTPEDKITPDAQVKTGLEAMVAAAKDGNYDDAHEEWEDVEGTVKQNEPDLYAEIEENLVLLKSADGDSAKVASSSSALEANVQAYLANYPG